MKHNSRTSQRYRRLSAIAVAIVALASTILIGGYFSRTEREEAREPFLGADEIATEIKRLPLIATPDEAEDARKWTPYVNAAQRLRSTDHSLTVQALREICGVPAHPHDVQKVMILLRVSFVCPSGTFPSEPKPRGGWISRSLEVKGQNAPDMNWPVAYKAGKFHLMDTLDGYLGAPYDGAAEFTWMQETCRWREFSR